MCESASKAMVVSSVRRAKGLRGNQDILGRVRRGQSWKQLTGWIGSPPAWSVLQDLYESTDGANSWEWSEGWSDSTDIDVSTWFGVTAKSGRVVGLALFSNSLRGEIPPSLGSLSNLRELLLHHNQLVGEIPPSLGSLHSLETLDLSANKLNGRLHDSLFSPSSRLQYVNLSSNRLSGELPEALGNLAKLEALHVDHNSFTGPLPSSIGKLQKLEVLNASNCWLTQDLPFSMRDLKSLKVLFLGHNRLTGSLDVLANLCTTTSSPRSYDDHDSESGGSLREVYANDNNLDVTSVHPTLRSHLAVLFVDRNRPRPANRRQQSPRRGSNPSPQNHHRADDDRGQQQQQPREDPLAWSTADLQQNIDRITQACQAMCAIFPDDAPYYTPPPPPTPDTFAPSPPLSSNSASLG